MKPKSANPMMVTKRKPMSNFQPNTLPPSVCLISLINNNIHDALVNRCGCFSEQAVSVTFPGSLFASLTSLPDKDHIRQS